MKLRFTRTLMYAHKRNGHPGQAAERKDAKVIQEQMSP